MGVCPISAWTHSASDLYMFVPLVQNSTISIPPNKFQSHPANFNPTQQISIPPRNQFIFRGQLNFSEFSYAHHPVVAFQSVADRVLRGDVDRLGGGDRFLDLLVLFSLRKKTRCLEENEEKHGRKENPERKKKIKERPLWHL